MKRLSISRNGYLLMLLCIAYLLISCSTPGHRIFEKRTPHESYEHKIEDAGLRNTALGVAWFNAAQRALHQPVYIQLPYKETAYFAAEQPGASGYIFYVRRGERLNVVITTSPGLPFKLFADLWCRDGNGIPKLLLAADTLDHSITYEAAKDDSCILRMQPELLSSGGYTVTINTGPTLAFPVPSEDHPKIGSFWGDSRDNGSRSHEGIDIFGKLRTPVVAAADGYITSVHEGGIGGKVVFLRADNKNYTLYYAHLDSQTAREGQAVKTGDVVGLMGNTGNARYTPTHLHFGIYTNSGAVDPLPFVDRNDKQPKNITAPLQVLNGYVRNTKTVNVLASPGDNTMIVEKLNTGTALRVIGATGALYKIQLPGKAEGYISTTAVTDAAEPVKTITIDSSAILLDDANAMAPGKKLFAKGSKLSIYGAYKDFYFIESGGLKGWIKK